MALSLILDILLAVLLVVTIGYAIMLNKRLGALRSDKDELRSLARDFAETTKHAELGIKELRSKTDILEEEVLTEFVQIAEQEVGLHENVFSKSHEAEQEEDYSPEYIEKVTEFDAEEEAKETVEEEVGIYFIGSNETTSLTIHSR